MAQATRTAPPAQTVPAPAPEPAAAPYPVPYYHPLCPDIRFRVGREGAWRRFANGRYVVRTPAEEEAVRAVLRHATPDPDRWKGDTGRREYVCQEEACFFRTFNDDAWDDHEARRHGKRRRR